MLLQRVLPLLRAQQHHQLDDGRRSLERGDRFALHQQVLAVRPDQGLGQEGSEVDHDLTEKWTDGAYLKTNKNINFLDLKIDAN